MNLHFQVIIESNIFIKLLLFILKSLTAQSENYPRKSNPWSSASHQINQGCSPNMKEKIQNIKLQVNYLQIRSPIFCCISEWSFHPEMGGLGNEFKRRKPIDSDYVSKVASSNKLDEELLQTKQWLLQRTLNLR